jgi:hypothetical protein
MDNIQHWSKSNNHWKWHGIRMPFWLAHFFDYSEFILNWVLNKLCDLAFEALRDQIFPWLIRWWRKSQQHQQYQGIVVRIHVAEEINVAGQITAKVSHASISNSQ